MAAQRDVAARLLAATGSHLKLVGELSEQLAEAEKGGSLDETPPLAWQGVQETFALLAKEFAAAEDGAAARAAAQAADRAADEERLAAEALAAEEQKRAAEVSAAEEQKRAADVAAAEEQKRTAEGAAAEEQKRAAEAEAAEAAAKEAAAKEVAAKAVAPTPAPAANPAPAPAAKSSLFGGAPAAKSSLFGGAPKTSLFANASQSDSSYGTSAKQRLLNRMQDGDSDEDTMPQDLQPVAAVAPGPDKWSVKAQAAAKVDKPKIPAMHTGMEGTFEKDASGNWLGTGISSIKPSEEAQSCVLKLDSSPEGEFDKVADGNWVKRGSAMQNIT